MESIAPAKAATTVTGSGIAEKMPCIAIVTTARKSFAPEEMPRTKGPAIGLRKKVWIRKPESESAPPSSAASRIRGSRIFMITL